MPNTPKVPEPEYKLRESYSETLSEMREICERDELSFMAELQMLAKRFNAKQQKRHTKEKRR